MGVAKSLTRRSSGRRKSAAPLNFTLEDYVMMLPSTLTHGIIETESGPISTFDLSYFLYHFRAAYVEALEFKKEQQTDESLNEYQLEKIAEEVASRLANKGRLGVSRNALKHLNADEELNFVDISRRNPIDIVFSCVGVALAAAVIISGGEIKWDKDGFKVKLPPLGKGIAELKKAINGNYQPRLPRKAENEDDPSPSP